MGNAHQRERAHPSKAKETGEGRVENSGSGAAIRYGFSSCQGWRNEMEDDHSCVDLMNGLPGCSFFGVFDGHGGAQVAHYLSANLVHKVVEHTVGKKSQQPEAELHEAISSSLPAAFLDLDNTMKPHTHDVLLSNGQKGDPGSTAVTTVITPSHLVFAHLGDARAVLCRNGAPVFVTKDHKPDQPEETKRIEAAGGFVASNRVCHCLAVSRAFGDYEFKDSQLPPDARMVSCIPDVAVVPRQADDEFVVLACDGVWDVLSAETVCSFVKDKLLSTDSMSAVCSELVDTCLTRGSTDNITAMVLCFSGAKRNSFVAQMIDSWFGGLGGAGDDAIGEEDEDEEEKKSDSTSASTIPAIAPDAVAAAPAVPAPAASLRPEGDDETEA